ncbi:uncharacterized protein PFL1_01042 [Pseudozyma flocculosa PF-1]|uniref:Large ribosomal subunit protein mL54 n=1 Tax=Pseudozyma flocculosa TaxID=84751 RepID=A0A5C3FB08_9BASI|nr:uncharacterized protein PFL1_01042 [Pseudozyma flocculosa PF-1]EPQ31709.1 hypothetical protein PFL1_01042 [Pseudozyma flocculosa PF-1]SPO40827.1 uncharacterized protein PSFLO_06309 [Pseudozyma flocculosa]
MFAAPTRSVLRRALQATAGPSYRSSAAFSTSRIVSRGPKGGKGKEPEVEAEPAAAQKPTAVASTSSTPSIPSAAPPGTVLAGLSILKDKADPVALEDAAYPPWLFKLLDDPSIASASSLAAFETAGMSKGEARAAAKRNAKLARAAQLAKEKAEAKAGAGLNKAAPATDGEFPVEGLSSEAISAGLADAAVRGEIDLQAETREREEKERKKAMRKANKEKIKARNFVSAS